MFIIFDNEKYISKGISERLSVELIATLWLLIDEAKAKTDLDYLQIFYLSKADKNGVKVQKIVHEQEIPEYKNSICVLCDNPINAKVYCIDSETYSTMILAEEY